MILSGNPSTEEDENQTASKYPKAPSGTTKIPGDSWKYSAQKNIHNGK
jgi:hypothetical protein